MATNKDKLGNKFASKRQSSSAESARKTNITPKGTEAFFDTADNTAKEAQAEAIDNKEVESQPTPKNTTKKQTSTTTSTSSKKKTTTAKPKPAPVEEKETGELIKTTVYIEEENFLALEDIQLKLKRQEKRRVTKNELFNKAIELLIKHYSD